MAYPISRHWKCDPQHIDRRTGEPMWRLWVRAGRREGESIASLSERFGKTAQTIKEVLEMGGRTDPKPAPAVSTEAMRKQPRARGWMVPPDERKPRTPKRVIAGAEAIREATRAFAAREITFDELQNRLRSP